MKKERKALSNFQQKGEVVKSRKQLRKEKKVQKKERKKHYYEARTRHIHQAVQSNQKKNKKAAQPQHSQTKQKKKQMFTQKESKVKSQSQNFMKKKKKVIQETEDDKLIKLYQEKLGVGKGKERYSKIAKNLSFDDDIFDFLDGISKKVQDGFQYQEQEEHLDDQGQSYEFQDDNDFNQQQEIDDQQDINEINQNKKGQSRFGSMIAQKGDLRNQSEIEDSPNNQQFDEEFEEMFDNLDQYDDKMEGQEQNLEEEEQVVMQQDLHRNNQKDKPERKITIEPSQQNFQVDQLEIQKSMNRLLNKLSDGNVLFTFREFLSIFQNYSKSTSIPVYAETFTKFNLMIQKPLFHILATNVALLVALHYALGNRLLAPVLYKLTQKYIFVSRQAENTEEVEELGYSKKFERIKNFATIISLLYNYKSINGQFVQSYVTWLTKSLDKNNIELIYIIIQKSGIKIRQNDPSTLKNIINSIRVAIESYKQKCCNEDELQKIKFIEMELNQIRFNKKEHNSLDQRMAFLQTFITKNIQKQIQKQKQYFPLNFQNVITADTSRTLWWEDQPNQEAFPSLTKKQQNLQEENQYNQEKKQLLDLAKSFHMVTQAKKNIFLCLMDSKDYLEATQRILELNIKHHQDIATVLVEVCTLEPNFNPYYPLVAAKIASLIPKFRLNLQYAIWDHLKLIDKYELRRTSNLAKFTAKLISDSTANSSLSILKFFPDLSNVRAIDTIFLNICFTYFFKKVKNDYLSKLVSKLREQNNRDIKLGIKEFLSDFECPDNIKEKVKLSRRLLLIEKEEHREEDDI